MTKAEQIRNALKGMAGEVGPSCSMLATVKSVDVAANTCVLTDDDIDYYDVRLRPVLTANESLTIYPKVNAWALAIRIEDDADWMVIACEEGTKARLKIGNSIFEMDGGFLIQQGNETIKKIMDDWLDAIQQLTVNTNVGPSSVPINIADFIAIKLRVAQIFK